MTEFTPTHPHSFTYILTHALSRTHTHTPTTHTHTHTHTHTTILRYILTNTHTLQHSYNIFPPTHFPQSQVMYNTCLLANTISNDVFSSSSCIYTHRERERVGMEEHVYLGHHLIKNRCPNFRCKQKIEYSTWNIRVYTSK